MALHTISVCTGLAGIERGLCIAAPGVFRPIMYCERELSVAACLVKEIEAGHLQAAPIWSDVRSLCHGSPAAYLDALGVDAIVGGYPCQPFSVAGLRRGEDDERHLWPSIAQAIERYQPEICFFENVEGHLVSGLDAVISDLEGMGFRVACGLFSAVEIGAPHQRKRLWILAHNDSNRREGFEERNESESESESGCDTDRCCTRKTT